MGERGKEGRLERSTSGRKTEKGGNVERGKWWQGGKNKGCQGGRARLLASGRGHILNESLQGSRISVRFFFVFFHGLKASM